MPDKPPLQLPQPTQDERTLAMLSYLLAIVATFVAPLIIYLIKKEESRFVAFHAGQAFWLNLLNLLTCGLASIVVLVVDIVWLIKAQNGEWSRLPLLGRWLWPRDLPDPDAPGV